jgi:Niemann-Pick C1 protein
MINSDLPEDQHVTVFPYSIFYVFYEQYLTIWEDTLRQLGFSLLAIFIVTFFMMGLDFVSAFINLLVIVMILINLGGMMYW